VIAVTYLLIPVAALLILRLPGDWPAVVLLAVFAATFVMAALP
jgi:hypothetical protein